MADHFGAFPRKQRLAILFLIFIGYGGFWLAGRLFLSGSIPDEAAAAAVDLRQGLVAAERKDERPPPEAFAFDPNTVSAEALLRLGLSKRQVASWLKYRGDRQLAFRTPADIGKLYLLSEDDKARLIPLAYVTNKSEEARPQVQSFAFDPNTVSGLDLRRLGLSEKQAAAFIKYRGKAKYGRAFRKVEDLARLGTLSDQQKAHLMTWAKIPAEDTKPVRTLARFSFDPNTISADSLERLGFPAWQAQALIRYRGDRPNTFRRATDLRRVKSLDSALVEQVLELVVLAPLPSPAPAAAPPKVPETYNYAPKALPELASFDINSADTSAWKTLPGVGSYRAKRIVRFREALGGFSSVAQVGDTRGLPDSTFADIQPYLKLGKIFRPLAINHATFEELNRHPYLSRNLANLIVRNREKFGRFNGPEDLKRLRLITEKNLPRLLPYFSFE